MDRLPRYPLWIILTYLDPLDIASWTLTRKRYQSLLRLEKCRRDDPTFSMVPDPAVLCDRLNTRRLHQRKRRRNGDSKDACCTDNYPPHCTTRQLADVEGRRLRQAPTSIPPQPLLRFSNQSKQKTVLVSYPRSGNTLLRTLLERLTGTVTGSDTRPDRSLSQQLAQQHDLVGEGVTTCQVVKSHFPERTGHSPFRAYRVVLVVRNPYDALDSYWNMNATKSHTQSLHMSVYEEFRDKFEGLVRSEMGVWLRFHHYWLVEQTQVPVLVVRFEDLLGQTSAELERVMKFIRLDERPRWKDRIQHVVEGQDRDRLGSYRPRTAVSSGHGKSLQKNIYSEELLDYLQQLARDSPVNYLGRFGYTLPDFPGRTKSPPRLSYVPPATPSSLLVNDPAVAPTRARDSPYGRALQQWRWSVTDHDRRPLATVETS